MFVKNIFLKHFLIVHFFLHMYVVTMIYEYHLIIVTMDIIRFFKVTYNHTSGPLMMPSNVIQTASEKMQQLLFIIGIGVI